MKKLIDNVHSVVPDMLHAAVLSNPGLRLVSGHNIVVRADVDAMRERNEVALISGGGAGHEPAHAGYVGAGMLTAAVVGDVFTSPSTDAVLAAIEAVATKAGVLLIVKNYTGDRLNFGLAAEIARNRGILVDMVIVADDAALAAQGDHAGRRGIAGTVLVHKIAGAAASQGQSLAQVKALAEYAIANVCTMGVALSSCTVPAAGTPSFTLGDQEIELGLGIHGEAGVERRNIAPVTELVHGMLDVLVRDQQLRAGDRVALLVNNLGATPSMELAIVMGKALLHLHATGLVVERAWSGTFLTAIEMAGVSLSLMKLDDALLSGLDAMTETAAWPAAHLGRVNLAPEPVAVTQLPSASVRNTPAMLQSNAIARVLLQVGQALDTAEPELTRMDQIVGDGDLGISMARAAQAVRDELPTYDLSSVSASLRDLSKTVSRAVGGTSGPLYATGLLRGAQALDHGGNGAQALLAAVDAIMQIGGAKAGDRTMLDALVPAAQAWSALADQPYAQGLAAAAAAAKEGAAATAAMKPRRGRTSYLGDRALGHMDPGAKAVAIWLQAMLLATAGPL